MVDREWCMIYMSVWFVVHGVWCMVCGAWSVVCGLWSVVCGLWSVVCARARVRVRVRVRVDVCVRMKHVRVSRLDLTQLNALPSCFHIVWESFAWLVLSPPHGCDGVVAARRAPSQEGAKKGAGLHHGLHQYEAGRSRRST